MIAEEHTNWLKEIRCMQVQHLVQPTPAKYNNLGHRKERGKS
jgi:hypothetical protein